MIISIFNQKGGVAKTTTATNLACSLSEKNKKVLLVDFDPQANSTNALGINDEELDFSVYDLLMEYNDIRKNKKYEKDMVLKFIMDTNFNINLIPADIRLAEAEQTLSNAVSRELLLNKLLSFIKDDYDFILIDCPPSLGLLSINALAASDSVIIPVYLSYFSVKGMKQMNQTFTLVRDNLNPDLDIMGFLITKFDQRVKQQKELKEALMSAEDIKEKIFKTPIRINAELEKAQDKQKPINFFNRECNGFIDYMNLADEVINYVK